MTPLSDADRIAQLEAALSSLRAEMQDFTYTVSHDLRASLRHVVSYIHLVQEDAGAQLPPEVAGFLQTASDSARTMGALMDGLLELSRMGTVPVTPVPLQMGKLLDAVVAEQAVCVLPTDGAAGRPVTWQRGTGWGTELGQPWVLADAALLRLALGHIIENALKFTAHQPDPRIAFTLRTDPGGAVVLTVQDNGAGFNPAYGSQLFRPFQRLHSTRQFPGIGMGLALTRKILSRFAATVSIQAEPDRGCCVQLTFPPAT